MEPIFDVVCVWKDSDKVAWIDLGMASFNEANRHFKGMKDKLRTTWAFVGESGKHKVGQKVIKPK